MVGLKICEDEYFDEKRQEYVMESFEFSNGKVLENVNVEYMTFGTPKYDDDIITNAIIYCHGSLGNFTMGRHLMRKSIFSFQYLLWDLLDHAAHLQQI